MIFIDSNIPMYVVGVQHANKARALRSLEAFVTADRRLVTSAEVLQEILHRYHAIDRHEAIQPALDVLLGVVDEVLPVRAQDVLVARDILMGATQLSSRDAVHIAVMQANGVREILSFDAGFDQYPGVVRHG